MTEFQTILLDTFKAFDRFCGEHKLNYFAIAGTALGAYRHQGFIPWDDDLDVVMKREDYEKFISIKKWETYKISHFLDGEFPEPFAKFYSTKYSIWENKRYPVIVGPWVDVFPIDLDDSIHPHTSLQNEFNQTRWKYRKTIEYLPWGEIGYDIIHLRGLNGWIKLVQKVSMPVMKKFYLHKLKQLINKASSIQEGDLYVHYGSFPDRHERRFFDEGYDMLPFEDTMIHVPKHIEDYLSFKFGPDYMTPPPPEKRFGHHSAYYTNLIEYKTVKEILKEKGHDFGTDKVITIKSIINTLKSKKSY